MERWSSGLRRSIGNAVGVCSVPWVQIPSFPPKKDRFLLKSVFFIFACQFEINVTVVIPICLNLLANLQGGIFLKQKAIKKIPTLKKSIY